MRWLRHYWDEEDVTQFFEIDDEGWVVRQVELRGALQVPTVAAARRVVRCESRRTRSGAGVRSKIRRARRAADVEVGRGFSTRRHRAGGARSDLAPGARAPRTPRFLTPYARARQSSRRTLSPQISTQWNGTTSTCVVNPSTVATIVSRPSWFVSADASRPMQFALPYARAPSTVYVHFRFAT